MSVCCLLLLACFLFCCWLASLALVALLAACVAGLGRFACLLASLALAVTACVFFCCVGFLGF